MTLSNSAERLNRIGLSKSRLTTLDQCEQKLWLSVRKPEAGVLAQDARARATYIGRRDITRFLACVPACHPAGESTRCSEGCLWRSRINYGDHARRSPVKGSRIFEPYARSERPHGFERTGAGTKMTAKLGSN